MDGFGGFDELMFRVVMCQIRKSYTSAEIHLVDVEVLSFDLRPCTALIVEVSYETNRNLVLDALTVGLPHGTEEQQPKFHLDCVFLALANLVDVCVPFKVSPLGKPDA
jgi:hypothetical protein